MRASSARPSIHGLRRGPRLLGAACARPFGRGQAALFGSLNETIARLHMIDHDAAGLGDFGRPQGYVARQIKRWSEQYRASETERIEDMERLIAWLPGVSPNQQRSSIVHGTSDSTIASSIQASRASSRCWTGSFQRWVIRSRTLTYHLMQWYMPPSPSGAGVGTLFGHEDEAGIPRISDYIEAYCRRTGHFHPSPTSMFISPTNFFRIAAILQASRARARRHGGQSEGGRNDARSQTSGPGGLGLRAKGGRNEQPAHRPCIGGWRSARPCPYSDARSL